jgi:hypothetical protein
MQDRADGLTVIEGGKASVEVEKAAPVDILDRSGPPVGSKAWATRTRRRAKELIQLFDAGYMELARILYQVFDTPVDGDSRRAAVFTSWGFDTFKDYAEQELGMHHKRAERLRRIWFVLEIQLKELEPELKHRIVNLGYSKVREMIKVITARNAEVLVRDAEGMTYKQIEQMVADENRRRGLAEATLTEGGDDDSSGGSGSQVEELEIIGSDAVHEKTTREAFELFPAQLLNVRLALERAAELSHSDKKGHQLDLICTDFVATNDVMAGDTDKRLRYLAKIERTIGLKLMAVDPEAKEVVYGLDALKIIAGD